MNIDNIILKSSHFDQRDQISIKESGVVFTNKEICDKIIDKIKPDINDKICEPSVGKGVFVFSLLEYFKIKHSIEEIANFVNNNLFCYDINNDFLEEFKIILKEYFSFYNYKYSINTDNIILGDFLLQNKKYDIIIGNPPYVRIQNLNKDYLNEIKKELNSVSNGNIDLYYAFLEKSLLYSKKIGFIIPNSFIKNKSGSFIRNLIKDRLEYIYDYKNEKIWKNISTYTCIVICDYNKSDTFLYETKDLNILKNKKTLSEEKWIIEKIDVSENKLSDLLNYSSIALSTIKDDVFKMDSYDDNYCYKNDIKIEKSICKKYIKATKDKNFEDYKYIIYPYINGKIIVEDILKKEYPLCYSYLLSRKDDLLSRDKGKTEKYDTWYAYGRKQGLLKEKIGVQYILPLLFLKSNKMNYIKIPDNEECLVLSGIKVDIKKDNVDDFLKIINDEKFYKFCELNNRILSGKKDSDEIWLSLSNKTMKSYNF